MTIPLFLVMSVFMSRAITVTYMGLFQRQRGRASWFTLPCWGTGCDYHSPAVLKFPWQPLSFCGRGGNCVSVCPSCQEHPTWWVSPQLSVSSVSHPVRVCWDPGGVTCGLCGHGCSFQANLQNVKLENFHGSLCYFYFQEKSSPGLYWALNKN